MRRSQRTGGLAMSLLLLVFGLGFGSTVVDDLSGRFRAWDGTRTEGVVVERYRGYKAIVPSTTVEYEVDGRTYRRELDSFLDEDERVEVRYLPSDPEVSRVVGAGVSGPVFAVLGTLSILGIAVAGFVTTLRTPVGPRPPRQPRQPSPAPVPETAEGRARRRERLRTGALVGAGAGAVLWGGLALRLGAGPPREVVSALLGLVGPGAALGALVGLLRSREELRRAGRPWAFRLGVLALLLAVPALMALAVAVEG